MDSILNDLQSYIPAEIDLPMILRFISLCAAGSLVIGIFNRFVLGKRSGLNHAVSSAMGILLIYVVTVVVYTFNPGNLFRYLAPLPFITFSDNLLLLFSFTGASIPEICVQVLSLLILSFLVNLLDTFIPKGNKLIGWYLYRFLTVIMAMALHIVITWLSYRFIPGVLVSYAPMILLGILAVLLLIGVGKMIVGLALTVVNPIIGGIYAFFFSHAIGKQLSKSVVTTLLLCALVYLAEVCGYSVISISTAALGAYAPLMAVLLVLWYLLGHVL